MSNYSFANSFSIGKWETYTPTWRATGTAPSFGNALVNGLYAGQGQLLIVHFQVTFGSTSTYGTGTYTFTLPPGYSADFNMQPGGIIQHQPMPCVAIDSGTALRMGGGFAVLDYMGIQEDNAADWGRTVPFTWAVNDNLSLMGMIKVVV